MARNDGFTVDPARGHVRGRLRGVLGGFVGRGGGIVRLLLCPRLGLLQLHQPLPVGDGDLIVIGVDFAER